MSAITLVLSTLIFTSVQMTDIQKTHPADSGKKIQQTVNIAHRGGAGISAENTLGAIKKAMDMKIEWIEIDVRQTKDRIPVVIHDALLDRTTSMNGSVINLTYKAIQQADAGSWFNVFFKGEKVPALEDVLKTVNAKAKLLVELKENNYSSPGIEKNVAALIKKYNAYNWVTVQSFDDVALANMHKADSAITLQKLYVGKLPLFPVYYDTKLTLRQPKWFEYASGINLHKAFATRRAIRRIHKLNKTVFVWTVDSPAEMKKMIRRGADGIITNRPDILKKYIVH
jgi:glycerophosphoryl diester phosphodiesterase